MDTLAKVGLGSDANLVLSEDKRGEIEAEGAAGAAAAAAASGLSFDATVQLIRFVRNSIMVSQRQLPEFIPSHAFSPLSLRLDVECRSVSYCCVSLRQCTV
jgi:hypothetical protein